MEPKAAITLREINRESYRAVFSLFIGVFVLWALYGNDESDRYFETNGRPDGQVGQAHAGPSRGFPSRSSS